jgi:hypothetical protein
MTRTILWSFFTLCGVIVAQDAPEKTPTDTMLNERLARIEGELAVIKGHLTKSAMPFQDAEFQLRVRVHKDGGLSILGRAIMDKELEDTLASLKPLFLRGCVILVVQPDTPWDRVKVVHDLVKQIIPAASVAFAPQTIQAEQAAPSDGDKPSN